LKILLNLGKNILLFFPLQDGDSVDILIKLLRKPKSISHIKNSNIKKSLPVFVVIQLDKSNGLTKCGTYKLEINVIDPSTNIQSSRILTLNLLRPRYFHIYKYTNSFFYIDNTKKKAEGGGFRSNLSDNFAIDFFMYSNPVYLEDFIIDPSLEKLKEILGQQNVIGITLYYSIFSIIKKISLHDIRGYFYWYGFEFDLNLGLGGHILYPTNRINDVTPTTKYFFHFAQDISLWYNRIIFTALKGRTGGEFKTESVFFKDRTISIGFDLINLGDLIWNKFLKRAKGYYDES
jgi:hypothetical protein